MIVSEYELTLIVGHAGAIFVFVGGYIRLHYTFMKRIITLTKTLDRLAVEHEQLIDFMCQEKGIKREDLPTRHKTVFNGGSNG